MADATLRERASTQPCILEVCYTQNG